MRCVTVTLGGGMSEVRRVVQGDVNCTADRQEVQGRRSVVDRASWRPASGGEEDRVCDAQRESKRATRGQRASKRESRRLDDEAMATQRDSRLSEGQRLRPVGAVWQRSAVGSWRPQAGIRIRRSAMQGQSIILT